MNQAILLPEQDRRFKKIVLISILLLIAFSLINHFFLNLPTFFRQELYFTFSATENIFTLVLALFIFAERKFESEAGELKWVSISLFCIAIFGFPIIFGELHPAFYWSRTIGNILGGVLVNLVWLPPSPFKEKVNKHCFLVIAFVILIPLFAEFYFRDLFPILFSPAGKYDPRFTILNVLSGLAFWVFTGFLLFKSHAKNEQASLALASYFAIFGCTRIMIAFSIRGDYIWWLQFSLRIGANFAALFYLFLIFQRSVEALISTKLVLQQQVTLLNTANAQIREHQKALEEQRAQMLHSARMASIGSLAGTVAHEINNPLAIISMNAEVLLRESIDNQTLPSAFRTRIQSIRKLTMRISEIVKLLLSLSREEISDPMKKTPLKEVIYNAVEISVGKFANQNIQLQVDLVPELFLNCRSAQISQVLLNLLDNAFDAIQELEVKWVHIQFAESEDMAIIKVIDSGPGIPPQIAERIMEPFFTTKEVNRGVGLGLSISKSAVEENRGSLYYAPQSPHTCFVIELPKYKKDS